VSLTSLKKNPAFGEIQSSKGVLGCGRCGCPDVVLGELEAVPGYKPWRATIRCVFRLHAFGYLGDDGWAGTWRFRQQVSYSLKNAWDVWIVSKATSLPPYEPPPAK